MLLREGIRMPGKFVGALLSDTKFFKMSNFFTFFYVLAQISVPVARHGWRLWEMKAGAWSFYLPKSRPRASHWPLQITKKSLGLFSGHFGSLFCAFSRAALVLWCWQMQALAWSFDLPESRLRKSRWRRDLTKTRFSGIFLSVLAHFSLFCSLAGWLGSGCNLVDEKLLLTVLIRSSFSSIRATQLQNETEKSKRKRTQNAEKLGLLGAGVSGPSAASTCLGRLCCLGLSGLLWVPRVALAAKAAWANLGLGPRPYWGCLGCLECLGCLAAAWAAWAAWGFLVPFGLPGLLWAA